MSNTTGNWANGKNPMPIPMGSEVVNAMCKIEVATANLTLNDLIILGELPADCVLVDAIFYSDDLDAGAGLVLDFGEINAAEDDLETSLETGLVAVGRAAGAARMTPVVATLEFKAGSTAGKKLGFKVATAAATPAAGTLGVSLSYRQAYQGA